MSDNAPTLEGTLDDVPLGSLLRLLTGQGRSGDVHLSGATPAIVRLHKGNIDFATGSDLSPLRRALDGHLTDADWDKVTESAVTPQDAVEKVINGGGLSPAAISTALEEQSVMTMFEFAVPGDDRFAFYEAKSEAEPVGPTFEVEPLLLQVDRRVEAWREIATTVSSTGSVFQLSEQLPDGIAEVRLGSSDWRVLAAADGRRSVADMVSVLGADAFSVCSAVHRLCAAQLLSPVKAAATAT